MIPLFDKKLRLIKFMSCILMFWFWFLFSIVFTCFLISVTYVLILVLHNIYSISICLGLNSVSMLLFCYFMLKFVFNFIFAKKMHC
jgi:hypothetical protein